MKCSLKNKSFNELNEGAKSAAGAIALTFLAGCASMGQASKPQPGPESVSLAPNSLEAGEGLGQDNMHEVPKRQYGRMTRQKLEEEAQLDSRAGSLWVPEGQGSYLFAENKTRLMGDLLNIKIEGAAKDQLQTKAKVIRTLLKRIEANNSRAQGAVDPGKDKATAATAAAGPTPPAPSLGGGEAADDLEKPLTVETVPTRIVDRLPDGNYRVEGSQGFMIGKREYRVLVSGIVRPQDFNDEGASTSKLLDPRFDIVSTKKAAKP